VTGINTWLPLTSSAISFIFSIFVLRRYARRKGLHLLLWGIGMVMYGIGGFCEGYYGAFGWSPLVFRLWYLFGAILVAAWLGQGTVYLLAGRRWAHALMILLALASLYGAVRVFSAELDPGQMTASVHTDALFQPVRHGDPGRRRGLVGLAVLAQARLAAPHHRQHPHRRRGHSARFWGHL
jgi:hypothetical protein